jgi:hypothetical protein
MSKLTMIQVNVCIYVPTPAWRRFEADVLDPGQPADPEVGYREAQPPETSATVELDAIRAAIQDGLLGSMNMELEPSIVVGFPSVNDVPDVEAYAGDEEAF